MSGNNIIYNPPADSMASVDSVSNSDGTITASPTTGAVVVSRPAITGDVAIAGGSNVSAYSAVVPPAKGGTGIANNAAMTVTGSGNFAYTRTLTASTNVTFPTSGTLATIANITTANQTSVYAAGTAYSLTNTAAALDFGTTDPSIALSAAGTYLIEGRCRLDYNAATFVANRTTTIKLRRTNNTPADLTNGSVSAETVISVGALSYTFVDQTWSVIYTTANTNDIVSLFGSIDTAPGAGSIDAVQAAIVAIRLQQ